MESISWGPSAFQILSRRAWKAGNRSRFSAPSTRLFGRPSRQPLPVDPRLHAPPEEADLALDVPQLPSHLGDPASHRDLLLRDLEGRPAPSLESRGQLPGVQGSRPSASLHPWSRPRRGSFAKSPVDRP